MAPLPDFRTNPNQLPFEVTGLDCLGPIVIQNKYGCAVLRGLSMTESHRGHIHTVPRNYLRIKFFLDGCKVALKNIFKYNFSSHL